MRPGDQPAAIQRPHAPLADGAEAVHAGPGRKRRRVRRLADAKDHVGIGLDQSLRRQQHALGGVPGHVPPAGQFQQVADVRSPPHGLQGAVHLDIDAIAGFRRLGAGEKLADSLRRSLGGLGAAEALADEPDFTGQFVRPNAANPHDGHAEVFERRRGVVLIPPDKGEIDAQFDDLLARDGPALAHDRRSLGTRDDAAELVDGNQSVAAPRATMASVAEVQRLRIRVGRVGSRTVREVMSRPAGPVFFATRSVAAPPRRASAAAPARAEAALLARQDRQ